MKKINCAVFSLLGACFFIITSYANTSEIKKEAIANKLIFAIDIVRHGDRTPTKDLSTSAYVWKEGLGQLTPTGMRQEYELGKKLRHRYVHDYRLLPPHYDNNTLYVCSTDYDRTLMSAESILLGLYPFTTGPVLKQNRQYALPGGYQPIPIHTVSSTGEMLLIPDHEGYHYDVLLEKNIHSNKAWREKNAALQKKYPAWSKATGVEITDVYQLKPIADVIFIHKLYHAPLPKGLSQADAEEIYEAGTWAFLYPFRNKKLVQITTTRLRNTIYQALKNASEHKSSKKYLLFSAHDSTILGQMGAFGAPLNQVPPYASDLNILLFQHGENNYYVKVTFNNHPVFIPKCGGTECSLKQFLS